MANKATTQWEFGELFPQETARRVLSVSDLTVQIKRLLERQLGQVWVSGEITNLRFQGSGHIYFTLKDAASQVSCVLFRGESGVSRELLEDGRNVLLQGDVTVYEPRGQYQLRVTAVELQGVGALQAAFEKLKRKLADEGLFAPERKRPLPPFPESIGLVTSAAGAAIRDVLHVVERRNPGLEIVLVPCRVQGAGASAEIAAGIQLLNEWSGRQIAGGRSGLDLILVTRGGGSIEDLWAFNEEILARAIFDSKLPVVSAVGHEIDFTISDFVADFRAATPSAGAEIITEGVFSRCGFIEQAAARLRHKVSQRIARERENLERWRMRIARAHPRRRLNERLQRLDDLQVSLLRCVRHDHRKLRLAWQNLAERLRRLRPRARLLQQRELLDQHRKRLIEQARRRFETLRQRQSLVEARLRLLSPGQVLARGYSITMDAGTGKVIRDPAEAAMGTRLRTRVAKGEIRSVAD